MDARDPEAHDSTAHPAKPYDINPYDIKKDHAALYAPRAGGFHVVEVPELLFLMVDGHGDPNVSHAYAEAVQALFTLSYAVRTTAKRELGRVHTVGPTGRAVERRGPPRLRRRGQERLGLDDDDRSTRLDHPRDRRDGVGSYDSEAPVLARLHQEYLPEHGLTFNGRHHEIYLSDPRRTEPAKLRTILRQPVTSRW